MKISFFIPSMDGGGAERVILNLVNGLSQYKEISVDLILSKAKGKYLNDVSENVRIIDLQNKRTIASLYGLIKYLNKEIPDVLISAVTHANIVAVLAKLIVKKNIKVILTQHNMLSNALKQSNKIFSVLFSVAILLIYPRANKIITVSKNIEQDIISKFKINKKKVKTIYNPIMEKKIMEKSIEPLNHKWFTTDSPPVILSVGRLHPVKDYPTLIRSFKRLRERVEVKLIILGDGDLRGDLIALSKELGVENDVQILGFVENPYQYMARAKVLVLTSIYEGFGNVIVEALGCGTPVVSTNCPGGVSEILDNGKYGSLVPVGDEESLSNAIFDVLEKPHFDSRNERLKRAQVFSVNNILKEYMLLIESI